MSGIKVTDRFMHSGFRERLGIDDMITVVQQVAAEYHEY